MREFGLAPSDLGLLTSAYFLAFGLAQLPVGVFLDRYGPRRVVATLLCVTALGAFLFGGAGGFGTLAARPRADRARRLGVPHGGDQGVHALVPALAPRDHQRLVHLLRRRRRARRDRAGRSGARRRSAGGRCSTDSRAAARRRGADRAVRAGEAAAGRGRDLGRADPRHRPDHVAAALLAHRAAVRDHARRVPGAAGTLARSLAHRRGGVRARGCGAAAARVRDSLCDRLGRLRQLRRPARRARVLPSLALQSRAPGLVRRVPRDRARRRASARGRCSRRMASPSCRARSSSR